MKKSPLVSGIIIFLNGEKFLKEAIESVFSQTYSDWELLLIDDGSTDGSTEIAKQYAQKKPEKVRYLDHSGHQNLGMSATRNLGIRHAKGEYVAFLDADDIWLPNKLRDQVSLLEEHPEVAMLYGRTMYWYSWSKENKPFVSDKLTREPGIQVDCVVPPPIPLLLHLRNEAIYPCTCSIIVRRQVFEKKGLFEEEFRDANEDMVFHSKLFLREPVYISSECWDYYRQHSDSYWAQARQKGLFNDQGQLYPARLTYLNWLTAYLKEKNIQNEEVNQALNFALWPYHHPVLYKIFWYFALQSFYIGLRVGRFLLPRSLRDWLWKNGSNIVKELSPWLEKKLIKNELP